MARGRYSSPGPVVLDPAADAAPAHYLGQYVGRRVGDGDTDTDGHADHNVDPDPYGTTRPQWRPFRALGLLVVCSVVANFGTVANLGASLVLIGVAVRWLSGYAVLRRAFWRMGARVAVRVGRRPVHGRGAARDGLGVTADAD